VGSGRFVVDNLFWLIRVVFSYPLEDYVAQTAQEVESVHDFYTQNATAINSAYGAMIADLSKKNMGDFLGEAKQVMEALNVLQQVHPFVGGVFTTH
jgi:hypothetical protein